MYLKPFLLIQLLALATTEIWAFLRLKTFGVTFTAKVEALAGSGYLPIPLPAEVPDYLSFGSLTKTGLFFAFTLGFTLGLVAFAGALCLNRFRLSKSIRVGWTTLISLVFSFLVGSSLPAVPLFLAFFGLAHFLIRVQSGSFHKTACLSLIPLLLIPALYRGQVFFSVRDALLQRAWGEKLVAFYYRYSPLAAELITPPAHRAQIAIWTDGPLGKATTSWLLRRGVYPISTRRGADLVIASGERTGPALLKVIRAGTSGSRTERLRKTISYAIPVSIPLAAILLLVFATDRLVTLWNPAWIVVLAALAIASALVVWSAPLWRGPEPREALPEENLGEVRRWALQEEHRGNSAARERFLRFLGSDNPSIRLWAATALAYLPSRKNVGILEKLAEGDPTAIVRCKAIFALSYQGSREVIPFLESRLKGREEWYVKHYLLRALRRLGWTG